MEYLIAGATVLTMDAELRMIPDAFVAIDGGKIVSVGKAAPQEKAKTVIHADGTVLLPGLIDAHTHMTDAILRCYGDSLDPLTRLETKLLPARSRIDARTARAAATVAVAEALRCGVTSFSALEAQPEALAEVAAQAGVKANIAPEAQSFDDAFDFDRSPEGQLLQQLHAQWHNYDGGRIQIEVGVCGEYAAVPKLCQTFGEYAQCFGLGAQLHLDQTGAEHEACLDRTGLTPAELLEHSGLFAAPRLTVAGCAASEPADLAILKRHGATAAYLPSSSLRQGRQPADPIALIRAGVNVALGSDGAANGSKLDLFERMRAASWLQSLRQGEPDALPCAAILTMATVCGAKAQGRQKTCGQIRPGMDADLILIDFTAPHLTPCHDLLSQLVHCVSGQDVIMTMVRGKILYSGGKFHTLDLPAAVRELTQYGVAQTFGAQEEKESL